jgi:hypothetical protein
MKILILVLLLEPLPDEIHVLSRLQWDLRYELWAKTGH